MSQHRSYTAQPTDACISALKEPATRPLHIRLLGEFQLISGEEPLLAINLARHQALLAYLLLHRNAPQARRRLAFLFWPDTNEAQALTNLRNLLHKLRQLLPAVEYFIHTDIQTVQWRQDAPYTLDVIEFEAAAQSTAPADWVRALRLYQGELLPSCYDDWILPIRQRLEQLAISTLERLLAWHEEQRDYRAAIEVGQRLLQLDPLNEATVRSLMRVHAANGERGNALRIYHTCVTTLQQEVGVEPAPATRELYQRLLKVERTSVSQPLLREDPSLVGRVEEWRTLQQSWRTASAGQAHALVLTGDAGIGKTRLAEELQNWVSRQGFATASAHCYAAEGALPYAPLVAWLRTKTIQKRYTTLPQPWLSEVARLLPEILSEHPQVPPPTPLTASWQRQRLFEALARALLTVGDPLLLLLDDLQWCDRDSLEWLHYLLRFAPRSPLLLVGTIRSAEVADDHPLSALLLTLRRDGILTELALGPLDTPETVALATAVAGQPLTPEQGVDLYQETEGNPLFVVETVRAWGSDWAQAGEQQATSATRQTLPPKVHAVIQARLAQLSPAARDLTSLAATIGRAFSFGVLAKVSPQEEDALVRSLDELWQRRIIRERSGDTYDFTHDKLREVAYNSLSAARRRLLHRMVAQALVATTSNHILATQATLDAVSGQVATHYELAGLYPEAIPYYQRAAAAAARIYTNGEAIRYYRRALTLLEGPANGDPAGAAILYEQLGDLLHLIGHYDEARGDFSRAVTRLPPEDRLAGGRLLRKIGNTWREQYQYPAALQAYQTAETQLTAGLSESPADSRSPAWWEELLQLWLDLDMAYYWLGRLEESRALRQRLEEGVVQHGSPTKRASFYQHRALLALRSNHSVATPAMVADCRAALAALQENGNATAIPAAQFLLGFFSLWAGEAQAALEPLQTALQLAHQTGDINLEARCLTYLTIAYRQTGQVEQALHYANLSLTTATTAHMPEYVGMAHANQAWGAWRQQAYEAAKQHGQAALAEWQQLPATHASLPFQWTLLWPLLAVALEQSALEQALEYAQRLLDPHLQRLPDALATLLAQANAAWTQTDPAAARSWLEQAVTLAQALHYL